MLGHKNNIKVLSFIYHNLCSYIYTHTHIHSCMDESANPEQPSSPVLHRHSADVCPGVGRMPPSYPLCQSHSSRDNLWLWS